MNTQQVCALAIVAACAIYLAKQAIASIRAFFSSRSEGCGTGCGKCAFARQNGLKSLDVAPRAARANTIPLAAVRAQVISDRSDSSNTATE